MAESGGRRASCSIGVWGSRSMLVLRREMEAEPNSEVLAGIGGRVGRLLQGLGQSVGRDFEGGDPSKLGRWSSGGPKD